MLLGRTHALLACALPLFPLTAHAERPTFDIKTIAAAVARRAASWPLKCAALCLFLVLPAWLPAQVAPPDFSVVLLPDTQNEAEFDPQELYNEIGWIVANRSAFNIQAVLGLGDIVNVALDDAQQQNANAAIRQLDDAGVPYFLALGNHDYDNLNTNDRTATGFNNWWGPWRYAGKSYYRDSYPAGSNANFYGVLTINGKNYLILVLEYNARDTALNWAAGIVQNNPDKEVIVVTHSFIFLDGSRADVCDTEDAPSDNYGARMWDKLISQYANIIMVVNGHFTAAGGAVARRADLGVNGNLVNQMLSNYQENANWGNGWLRILIFHPGNNSIHVQTYSPTIPDSMTDGANDFYTYYHNPGFNTGTGAIAGKVWSTGCKILAGATVSAGGASATTDANGRFRLSVPAPASYTLSVQAAGYQSRSRSVQVNDNYSTQANFYLSAGSSACTLSTVSPSVTICTPSDGATVTSPVHLVAGATDSNPVARMESWVDGAKTYTQSGNTLDTWLSLGSGTHRVVAVAAESSGAYFSKAIYINVNSTTTPGPCQLSSTNHTVTICTPSNNATVSNPVHVVAGSTDTTGTVARMEVWVDGAKIYTQSGNSLDANLSLAPGSHRFVVVAAENSTTYFSQAIYITVQ